MKYDLFISYSRADYWDKKKNVIPGNIVSQIVDTLEAYQRHYNFEYFFDQEAIESRAAYLKRIASAIDESKVMLFVASKSSYSSEFCSKELNFADKREIPIFQYCIDDAKTPLDIELLLGTHQFRSSKHYPVEKIVQDALSEALGFKVKPLSELTHVQPHITDGHTPKFKRVANLSIKTIVGVVVSAILLFSALFVFEVIFRDTEPIIPPLIDKNITPIEIEDSLTASQLFFEGHKYFEEKDYNSAVQYYYKSAHMGYSNAQNNLGTCYQKGLGVSQDYTEAVKWFCKAVKQKNAGAQYNLGCCYYFGYGVIQNYAEAVKWYRKAAKQGDAHAQNYLGLCYEEGSGVPQDYAEAVKWLRKAAEQGYVQAQNHLGFLYYSGYGVNQDYAEAVKWCRKAAEQGDASAQYNVGICYEKGHGVTRDYAEAVKWYRKAAEQGHTDAQSNLGKCYYNGNGVTQDYAEAVKWYRKAAEQGNASAQYSLGLCYYEGRGVTRDYEVAVKWSRKAAEQGYATAQCSLGVCYEKGLGVTQDYAEAVKWYRKAAEQGNESAKETLRRLGYTE